MLGFRRRRAASPPLEPSHDLDGFLMPLVVTPGRRGVPGLRAGVVDTPSELSPFLGARAIALEIRSMAGSTVAYLSSAEAAALRDRLHDALADLERWLTECRSSHQRSLRTVLLDLPEIPKDKHHG